jgi:coatomer subunit gamma
VAAANVDLEALIGDSNRSVATLAITTLLRTGAESSVERLMKQIQAFLADIADENKCVVVNAVRALCLKYPVKHRSMLAFLAATLRDEGGFEYKRCIVDAIVALIHDIPEAA